MEESKFREWLRTHVGLGQKSAKDVLSRLRRVQQFFDVHQDVSEEELLFRLEQTPEFNQLTMSVKSQVKRAVRLYREFCRVYSTVDVNSPNA